MHGLWCRSLWHVLFSMCESQRWLFWSWVVEPWSHGQEPRGWSRLMDSIRAPKSSLTMNDKGCWWLRLSKGLCPRVWHSGRLRSRRSLSEVGNGLVRLLWLLGWSTFALSRFQSAVFRVSLFIIAIRHSLWFCILIISFGCCSMCTCDGRSMDAYVCFSSHPV